MNMMVVDDSRAMRNIVRRTLRQAGYGDANVIEAMCGDEAQSLRAAGLVTRFGLVTSEGTTGRRAEAAQPGVAFLIAKPFTAETSSMLWSPFYFDD
jgi:two-component system, chemotaxis family, chemotaxis protein CheY